MDLGSAFDRLADFVAVQTAEHGGLTTEGVDRLQQAVGVRGGERRLLLDRLPEVAPAADDDAAAAVLLGVLLGLLAADAPRG
jgi:hypothetical protein